MKIKKDYSNLTKEQLIEEIQNLLSQKKYGLVWEDKEENVVTQCQRELPVLEEVKDKEISTNASKPVNLLIEGDNYHALSVLNYTHAGKIDVIYIDPPYNTGARDWKYNNNYVDINDTFRHSKWISFMKNRLAICKQLLTQDGVIIIAIDDNESATLSLLLDELYPEKIKNTVVIVNNPHGVSRSGFSRCHEYAIFLLNPGQTVNKKKAPMDNREINLRRTGNNSDREDSPTMFYPIIVDKSSLKIIGAGEVPPKDFHPKKQTFDKQSTYELWPIDKRGKEKNWYYSRQRVLNSGSNELFCKWVKEELNVYFSHSNNGEQAYKSFWVGSEYDAGAYGASLVQRMVNKKFPFPKSITNVLDCLKAVIKSKNATILDFFAGSGTTGHAVMILNKEDGGSRKFILCTNNENKIAEEITYPRIVKAIKGYDSEEPIETNLKYFKTSFVNNSKVSDDTKYELVNRSTEMICIREETYDKVTEKNYIKIFKNNDYYTAILFHLDYFDDFKKELKKLDKDTHIYVFSLTSDTYEEDFRDLKQKYQLCPIPESILQVYKRVFRE